MTSGMSKTNAQTEPVPRLRFPEFRDSDGWVKKPLGDIVALWYGSSLPENDRTGEGFPVVGSNGVVGYHEKATVSGPAIVIGRKGSVGQINLIEDDCTPIDTTFHVVPKRPNRDDFYFIWRLLEASRLNTFGDAGAVPGLNRNDVYARRMAVPDLAEQRKIAECLGSLDDLIAAERRKLAALRGHKKGLMQQLFPREGETQPRLRFPEFENAGEWAQATLGELSEIVRGGSPRPIDDFLTRDVDGLNWLKIGDLETEGKYVTATEERVVPDALPKTRLIEAGDLILSNSMSFGRPYLSLITTCIHDGWIAVRDVSERLESEFLYYAILAPSTQAFFKDWASGGGIRNLNIDIVKYVPMGHPSRAEQHRIADCLAALDAIINAQAEKLDALRNHKRGLMQQLFPSPEDAAA